MDADNDDRCVVVPSKEIGPEEACVKRDSFEKLSEEAKDVIKLILDCPAEFLEMIWPKKTYFKDRVLVPYLRKRLGTMGRRRVMDELREFVSDF